MADPKKERLWVVGWALQYAYLLASTAFLFVNVYAGYDQSLVIAAAIFVVGSGIISVIRRIEKQRRDKEGWIDE